MKLAYHTTKRLISRQAKFWDDYPEMDDVFFEGPLAIPVKSIFIDDEFPDPESIPKYQTLMLNGTKLPPILVTEPSRKGGKYRVVDGKHRFTAARDNGATHILALVETYP